MDGSWYCYVQQSQLPNAERPTAEAVKPPVTSFQPPKLFLLELSVSIPGNRVACVQVSLTGARRWGDVLLEAEIIEKAFANLQYEIEF